MQERLRRNSAAIIGDLLRFAEAPKTRHRAKLSNHCLEEYLDFLVDEGFLQEVPGDGRISFRKTGKGIKLLKQIDGLEHILVRNYDQMEVSRCDSSVKPKTACQVPL